MSVTPILVAVDKLSYEAKPRSWLKRFNKANNVELLHNVSFLAKPGELTAILGPSGCGKTTLVNIIADRASGIVTSGQVYFNGNATKARHTHGAVALLNANDRLLPYLSVRETLTFTAYLRMPDSSLKERQERVDSVLEDLALTHTENTKVGGAWKKGLSTGEMRRCSIAMELIGDPAVLILDEPTSGLDAVLAYEVIAVLKNLATKGRTIVCTLHQPRSSVCRLIDNVAVMARGRIMFQGTFSGAQSHFSSALGKDIASQGNYADGLLDIASNTGESSKAEGETLLCDKAADSFEASPAYSVVATAISQSVENPVALKNRKPMKNSVMIWFNQVYGVAFRTFRNSWNNPITFLMSIAIQLGMGIFLGFIFFKLPQRFLPYEKPVYIGDESSGPMQLMNSSLVRLLVDGVDDQGTNPLIDMLTDGVDGKGSDPLGVFANSTALKRMANMMPCAHNRLGLAKKSYYQDTNFDEYQKYWNADPAEMDLSHSQSQLVIGEYSIPNVVGSILQGLQFVDYAFYKLPWLQAHETCVNDDLRKSYIPCFGCHGEIGTFLDVCSECTEIPQQPPAFSCGTIQSNKIAAVDVFDENGNLPTREADNSVRYPDYVPPKPAAAVSEETVDAPARQLSAAKRKLQISGLMGGGFDLSTFLPPTALAAMDTLKDYEEAIRECKHPVCDKMVETLESSSTSSGGIADYAAVMGAVLNISGALYFSVSSVGFAAYDGLTSLCQDRPLINRELMNKTYRPSAYFIGRTIGEFLFHVIPVICMVLAFHLIIDVDNGPHGLYLWKYLGICIMLCATAYGFSYLVSALSPSMEAAVIAAPLILVLLMTVAGFFVRDSAIPQGMVWLKYISYYRWGFFALLANQFPENESYWGLPNSFNLALIGVSERRVSYCILWLALLCVAFRFLAYLALKYCHRHIGVET